MNEYPTNNPDNNINKQNKNIQNNINPTAFYNEEFIDSAMGLENSSQYQDMPLGLMMSLGSNAKANGYWGSLDTAQKGKVMNYIKAANGSDDAKNRVNTALSALSQHNLDMLN